MKTNINMLAVIPLALLFACNVTQNEEQEQFSASVEDVEQDQLIPRNVEGALEWEDETHKLSAISIPVIVTEGYIAPNTNTFSQDKNRVRLQISAADSTVDTQRVFLEISTELLVSPGKITTEVLTGSYHEGGQNIITVIKDGIDYIAESFELELTQAENGNLVADVTATLVQIGKEDSAKTNISAKLAGTSVVSCIALNDEDKDMKNEYWTDNPNFCEETIAQ